jgi:hypothetical protein
VTDDEEPEFEYVDHQPTPAVDEIRKAFAGVAAAIIDSHPPTPTRQAAIEAVMSCHANVVRLLSTPTINGITALWLTSSMH